MRSAKSLHKLLKESKHWSGPNFSVIRKGFKLLKAIPKGPAVICFISITICNFLCYTSSNKVCHWFFLFARNVYEILEKMRAKLFP